MLTLLQTGIYKDCVQTVSNILNAHNKKKEALIMQSATKEAVKIAVNLAKALQNIDHEEKYISQINQANEYIVGTITLLQLATKKADITEVEANRTIIELEKLQNKINVFLNKRKKILILSSCMGQGHMSASKALKQGLENIYGLDYNVEIIDFWEEMNAFLNKATKSVYEGSTKFTPKIYKFIFASTDTKWQMKLINQINYPFVLAKVKKMFEDKNPDLVISTYPIWDYMTADIWKKVKPNSKFLSVVTDSISIHNAWAIADTDFHIVANEDTALSLRKLGVKNDKIKVLGFPIRLDFINDFNRKDFIAKQDLDPEKFTILFLPTAQKKKLSVEIMADLKNHSQDCNIIVVTGRDPKLKPMLEKIAVGKNIKIIGWTDNMAEFLKSSDLVITKAGGATVMECIATEKPMIITSIIPGQEEGNGELIKRYHLGIIPGETNMSIFESVNYIRQNYKQFQKNLAKLSNPKSALKIAEFINSVI